MNQEKKKKAKVMEENKENKNFYNNRDLKNKKKRINRIKIGVIVAIIIGTVIVACEAFIEINYNWNNVENQKNYNKYRDGEISYDEYYNRTQDSLYDYSMNVYVVSIISSFARVGLNASFILIIIGFLSITIDNSFNKKMRRISLIIASIILLFMMSSIFVPSDVITIISF